MSTQTAPGMPSSPWTDGIPPLGAISGRAPDAPARTRPSGWTASATATATVRRHRRPGAERGELLAAALGGAIAVAAIALIIEKVVRRG